MNTIQKFYQHWCKKTNRNGGVLVGASIREFLQEVDSNFKLELIEQSEKDEPKIIGLLNKRWGLKGYKIADVGHPVYEYKDRYIIYLEPENPKLQRIEVPFYKQTLKSVICKL